MRGDTAKTRLAVSMQAGSGDGEGENEIMTRMFYRDKLLL